MKEMKKHQFVIYKCKQTAKQSPTEAVRRVVAGVEYHKKMLSNHDKELEERIEKTVRRLREDAEETRKNKQAYLADAEKRLADMESIKSRAQISAEIEVENLRKKLVSMNLPRITPVVTTPTPNKVKLRRCPCGKGCEDVDKCLMTFKTASELAMEKKAQKELEEERKAEEREHREESELTQPIQQPPLTPFQGLPPPDVQRAIKPTKMVKTSLRTYATKMYATPVEII